MDIFLPRLRSAAHGCAWLLAGVLGLAAGASGLETISGTIRDAASAQPLAGIDLDLIDASGASFPIGAVSSDAIGRYTIVVPGPGSYRVRADPATGDGHVDQYYNGTFLKSTAQTLVVGANQALFNIDFFLPLGAPISGVVTAAGVAAANIDIDVFAANGEFLPSYPATSGPGGTYTVGSLPPGDYFIRADPDPALGQLEVRTFYGGSMAIAGATPISLGSTPISGIDIDVPPGGAIAGTIADAATGAPLALIDLDLFDSLGKRVDVTTKSDVLGAYEIGAVPAGSYLLRADPTSAQGYAQTYYPNAATENAGQLIPVSTGAVTAGIDFALGPGATIRGTIREAGTGVPIAGIDLDVFDAAGSLTQLTATSDAAGVYQVGPMQPGTYFLRADPTVAQGYAVQYYAGRIDIGLADPIATAPGSVTPNIDFDLVRGGSIAGSIVEAVPFGDFDGDGDVDGNDYFTFRDAFGTSIGDPGYDPAADADHDGRIGGPDLLRFRGRFGRSPGLAGIDLDLYDAVSGVRLRTSATSAADGSYRFDQLAPGQYKVRADASGTQGFALEYWNGKLTRALADAIPVSGAATTAGIDLALDEGGSISGTLTDPVTGAPLAGFDLDVFQAGTLVRMDQGAITDVNGSFTFVGLPLGAYIVRADAAPGSLYLDTYFARGGSPARATPVTVVAGGFRSGVDFAVQRNLASIPATGRLPLVALAVGVVALERVLLEGSRPEPAQSAGDVGVCTESDAPS